MTQLAPASDRNRWIAHARDGVEGAGTPDARALSILEASQGLAPLAQTRPEKQTLVRLTRAAIKMGSVRDDDLRREDILHEVAEAWAAFESVWQVSPR